LFFHTLTDIALLRGIDTDSCICRLANDATDHKRLQFQIAVSVRLNRRT
jgi:hypothetical protein